MTGQGQVEHTREEAVNVILAEILRDDGLLDARAERRRGSAAPDIRVALHGGESIILECKWADSRRELEEQLENRLEQFPETLALVGILYPERFRTAP